MTERAGMALAIEADAEVVEVPDGFVERRDRHEVTETALRLQSRALWALGVGFLVMTALFVLEWRDEEIRTLVFAVKEGEPSVFLGEATGVSSGGAVVVEAMLYEFVRVARRVSSDRRIVDEDFGKAQAFLTGGALARYLADVRSFKHNPYWFWHRGHMVTVEVESVLPQEGSREDRSWVLDWTERVIDKRSGREVEVERWRATATVDPNHRNQDVGKAIVNAGVFIDSWSPRRLGSGEE